MMMTELAAVSTNVHTKQNPKGDIRGQISLVAAAASASTSTGGSASASASALAH